ncbi:NTF2-like protein [Glonium stellatum]|uniref:NTF2-like protein n=1 Tax=Glonium stellatum TaxID=574774 RepID=A0A8E2EP97_9PEZI|nr:NTF2-like protein [Glonium stellatum]
MSLQDRNKQIVAEYYREYWTLGNPNIVDKLCAEDFVINYPIHGRRQGREAAKQMLLEFKRAFPNISFHSYGPYPLIADQDYVVVRWIGGGKHTGEEYHNPPSSALNQPNTDREMYFTGTTIYTLRDGLIVQEVGEESGLNAMHQLGLIPPERA